MKPNFTSLSRILIIVSILLLSFNTQAQTQIANRDASRGTAINFSFATAKAENFSNGTYSLVNGAVNLNWVAGQEMNNDHFEMERSLDGKNFAQIGIILGGFEDGAETAYAYRDRSNALQNQNSAYYRLKQIDQQGHFAYSSIVTVRLETAIDGGVGTSQNIVTESVAKNIDSNTNSIVRL